MELIRLRKEREELFKKDMQYAFKKGAEEGMGAFEGEVLPEEDIMQSLGAAGAAAYEAVQGDETIGGAIVVIDESGRKGDLHFLYVKHGCQSKGVGQAIWREIERLYLKVDVWETCTPYFEKRNIHFYVNRCGFHIVEFFCKFNRDPNEPTAPEEENDYFEGMFRFEKRIR